MHRKAFSYPERAGDGTTGVGPKVNDAASAYWTVARGSPYYFDLTPTGLANPYQALVTLFTEHDDPKKRTLFHCDYLVSVLEFRAFAENVGPAAFNVLVQRGALTPPGQGPMRLRYDGFTELMRLPAITMRSGAPAVVPTAPLQMVEVPSKTSLIIGDHVVFYNHETYAVLTAGLAGAVWSLENAIVVDNIGGQFRYQGHGYFSPVPEDALLDAMIRQYNTHVDEAGAIVHRVDHGTALSRAAAETERARKFPNVKRKAAGGWVIDGVGRICNRRSTRDLIHLTRAEAPALKHPCFGRIWVRRAVERKPGIP